MLWSYIMQPILSISVHVFSCAVCIALCKHLPFCYHSLLIFSRSIMLRGIFLARSQRNCTGMLIGTIVSLSCYLILGSYKSHKDGFDILVRLVTCMLKNLKTLSYLNQEYLLISRQLILSLCLFLIRWVEFLSPESILLLVIVLGFRLIVLFD